MTAIRFLSLAIVAALALMPVACSDDDAPTASGPSPTVKIIPRSIDFGTVRVGQTATAELIIMNDSAVPITLDFASTDDTNGVYSTYGFKYSGEVLIPGVGVKFSVLFAPDVLGSFDAKVIVTFNSTKTVSAILHGHGALPDIEANSVGTLGTSFTTTDDLPLTYRFSEIAQVESGAFSAAIVISADQVFDPSVDILVGGRFRLSMDPGEVDSGQINGVVVPERPSSESGPYYLGMMVDWTEGLVEVSETNNIVWTPNTIDFTFFEFNFMGTVTDSSGTPLEGLPVLVAGTRTDTDANGDYGPVKVNGSGPHLIQVFGPIGLAGGSRDEIATSEFTVADFTLVPPTSIIVWHFPNVCGGNDMSIAAGQVATAMYGSGVVTVTTSETSWWAMMSSTHDISILEIPVGTCSLGFGTGTPAALTTWLQAGEKLIFSDPTNGQTGSPMWGLMGIATTGSRSFSPTPLIPVDPNHIIATFPNEWPAVTTAWPDRNGANNANNTLAPGGVVVATVDGDIAGAIRIVVREDGKTLFCASALTDATGIDRDTDGVNDAVEMWQNFITWVLAH